MILIKFEISSALTYFFQSLIWFANASPWTALYVVDKIGKIKQKHILFAVYFNQYIRHIKVSGHIAGISPKLKKQTNKNQLLFSCTK